MNFDIFHLRSLKTRVTLITLAIFLIGFWSLSFYASRMLREDMQHLLGDQQFSTVSILAAQVNQELKDRLRSLEKIAEEFSPAIMDDPAALQALLERHPILQSLFNGGIFVTGIDGTAIAAIPLSIALIDVNFMDRDYIAAALKEGKSTIGRPVMGKKLPTPVFSVGVPIRDTQGKAIGVLAGITNLAMPNFMDKITENRYGKSGGYFLVARQYRLIVTASDKTRVMEHFPAPGINPTLDRYIQGYEGSAVYVNPLGVEVLGSAKGIPVAGWFLGAILPTQEAFTPIRAMQQRMLLTTILLTLLAGSLTWWMTWWMLRRHLSPMLTATETLTTLSNSNQPPQPLPITSQDEIGQLIGGFNRLLETLAQREEALKESEEKFRMMVETIPLAIHLSVGIEQISEYLNPEFIKLFGYTLEDMPTIEQWWPLAYPDEEYRTQISKEWTRRINRAIETQSPIEPMETVVTCKDGSKKIILWGYIALGEKNYSCGLDLTERKRTEDALLEYNELFKLFIRHSPVYCYIKDVNSTRSLVLQASENYQNMIGIPGSEMVGKTMEELFPPEFAAKILADDWAVISKGDVLRLDEELNGRSYTSIKFPIVQGNRTLLAGYTIDITERKQAEVEKAKLEAQNRQLQKAESLGRMAGAIAHHFNNQLQVVMGSLEMAMVDQRVNSNESLVSAMQAARKAADVSRLMLIYLGQAPGKNEPIDLSETCRQSLTLLQTAAPKGMILKADFPSSGPVIRADTNQMHQILTNLITNAWEAISDNRGAICLTIKTVSHEDIPTSKRFPIDWQPQRIPYACLEVTDTGCGIPDKDIEKIFDPFFTTKFTGRGLGLPVVMGIVKAYGGSVTVDSEPGQGSVLSIFLPVSTEELPCRHDLPTISGALQTSKAEKVSKIEGGGTVLLIEDEEQVRDMAQIMLTRLGFTVLEAKDGIDALEIFQQHRGEIRCVLSDLTMPRMDGWDTLAALRKLSPGIPVILSSGYDEAQVMSGEHPERPNAFLGKPYQLKGLSDTINRILS